jgi:signal transduction histidine kinase
MLRTKAFTTDAVECVPSNVASTYPSLHVDTYAEAGLVRDMYDLLQVASSALSIISRSPSVGSAPALVPVIDGARVSLQSAAVLARQAMGFARERSDVIEYVDVSASIAEIERIVRATWPSTIRIDVSASCPLYPVRCSPIGFQNAIMNLTLNARDAMPNGGVISIGVAAIPQSNLARQIEVRVTDSGLGMTQETLEQAFDPYFTTKTDGLGGLGLPMVQRFAQEAGGQVKIESALGVGTSVSLRLPVSAFGSKAPAPPHPVLSQEIVPISPPP